MIKRDVLVWLPGVLLIAALVALFYPLAMGKTLFWGLPALQFYPWRQLAFEQLADGQLPAWNSYLGAGAPLLANYQTAVFYPPNWLYLLLPGPAAMSVIALGHVLWAGFGMWLFAGRLGLSAFGRGISALSYALGGYLIARLGSFPTANTGAWMPWVLLAVHDILIRRRLAGIGGLALVLGLQLLAGHAQTTWYSSLGAGAYGVWLVLRVDRGTPWRTRVVVLGMATLGVLLGVLLAAIQLIPTAEYLRESQRSDGLDYESLSDLSYSPFRLITLFNPNFFGTPADGSYFTEGMFFEDAAYIGFIPITAVLAALVARWRLRRDLTAHPDMQSTIFWCVLALVTLIIAMGKYGPVFHPLYDYVPTFDTFRDPVRWLIITQFGLAILAGIGVGQWGRGPRVIFWSRLAAAGGGGMAAMALAYVLAGTDDQQELGVLARGLVVLGGWIMIAALLTLSQPDPLRVRARQIWRAAVLSVVALDLTWAAAGLNPMVPDEFFDPVTVDDRPAGRLYWFDDAEQEVKFEQHFMLDDYRVATRNWRAARMSLLPNLTMLDKVPSFVNDDPFQPRFHQQYVDLIEDLGARSGELLHAAGVTRVIGLQPVGWIGQDGIFDAPTSAGERAWLVGDAAWYADDEALIAALRDPDWVTDEVVLLAGQPDADMPEPAGQPVGQVSLIRDDPAEQRYRVTAEAPAYLVISSAWYPGWTVEVNGRDAPLYRANLAFVAVPVPGGESEVILRYHLTGWPWIAVVTALAGLVVLGFLVLGWRRRGEII